MSILQRTFNKNADIADAIFDVAGNVGDFVKERKNEYVAVAASFAVSAAALPFIAICEATKAVAKATRRPLTHTSRY